MWIWLAKNKDSISALGTVLQSIAVIAGIVIIINEFVVKDRVAERTRVDSAIALFQGPYGMNGNMNIGDLFFDVIGETHSKVDDVIRKEGVEEFYEATIKTVRRYTQLQTCLEANTCDHSTVRKLFCGDAFFDSFVAYKVIIRPWDSLKTNYDDRLDNLFDFYLGCIKDGYRNQVPARWLERRTNEWDKTLEPVFRAIDEKWHKGSEGTEKGE